MQTDSVNLEPFWDHPLFRNEMETQSASCGCASHRWVSRGGWCVARWVVYCAKADGTDTPDSVNFTCAMPCALPSLVPKRCHSTPAIVVRTIEPSPHVGVARSRFRKVLCLGASLPDDFVAPCLSSRRAACREALCSDLWRGPSNTARGASDVLRCQSLSDTDGYVGNIGTSSQMQFVSIAPCAF